MMAVFQGFATAMAISACLNHLLAIHRAEIELKPHFCGSEPIVGIALPVARPFNVIPPWAVTALTANILFLPGSGKGICL